MRLCTVLFSFVVLPLSAIAAAASTPSSPKVIDVHVIINSAPTTFTGVMVFSGNSSLPDFTHSGTAKYPATQEFYASSANVQHLVDQGYTKVTVSLHDIGGVTITSPNCATQTYTLKTALPLTLTMNAFLVSGKWDCNIN